MTYPSNGAVPTGTESRISVLQYTWRKGDYRNGYREEIDKEADREENCPEKEIARKKQEDNQEHRLQKKIGGLGRRMKTLSDYRKDYYWFSGKASDVARQLAFAGIAFLWIFRVTGDSGPAIPRDLIWPAILFASALAFDLLQYISGTLIWGWFQRSEEKKLKDPDDNPELSAPTWYVWPINSFFAVKLICVILAYILLIAKVGRILLQP